MSSHKAVVKDGHLVLKEPTDLPEGTVVELFDDPYAYLDDDDDEMDEEERDALHAMLDRSLEQMRQGQTRPLEDVLEDMRRRE